MRKVILDVAVSLDGYIEGPNGEYDWCFMDQDYGITDVMNRTDSVFFGRKSWELFGNFTPSDNAPEMEKKFFDMIGSKKKYVFSRTLKYVKGAVLINSNVEDEVTKIKQQKGKDIYLFGGASLITTFVNSDLIDEYQLALHPIILGAGKPLFMNINKRKKLMLSDSKTYQTGLIMLTFKPDRKN